MKLTAKTKDQIVLGILNDVPYEPYLDQLQDWLNGEAFEQLPEVAKTPNLPAPQVSTELMKAGWPKK